MSATRRVALKRLKCPKAEKEAKNDAINVQGYLDFLESLEKHLTMCQVWWKAGAYVLFNMYGMLKYLIQRHVQFYNQPINSTWYMLRAYYLHQIDYC